MERPGWRVYWQTFAYGCAPCAAGTYKSTPGFEPCQACNESQYSAASPSDDVGVGADGGGQYCAPCPPNTTAPPGVAATAAECTCAAGFYDLTPSVSFRRAAGVACVPCPAGTFQPTAGASACIACGQGTFSALIGATAHSDCAQCPHGSVPAELSTVCECLPGFQPVQIDGSVSVNNGDGNCVGCPSGKYKDAHGPAQCEDCSPGKYATYEVKATSCSLCPGGTYSTAVAAWQLSVCTACPSGSASLEGRTSAAACICGAGYFTNGSQCERCPPGDSEKKCAFRAPTASVPTFDSSSALPMCILAPIRFAFTYSRRPLVAALVM